MTIPELSEVGAGGKGSISDPLRRLLPPAPGRKAELQSAPHVGPKSPGSASVGGKKSLVEINLVLICTAPGMYCHASF